MIHEKEIEIKDIKVKQNRKSMIKKYLKFLLIPGWRDPDISAQEYEIEKIKSKRRLFRRFLTPLTIIGIIMVLFCVVLGVFAPFLTTIPLQEVTLPYYPSGVLPFEPPSPEHPLGTTFYGYDILARIIWGARTTLSMALVPVIIAQVGGLVFGTISAYFGGWVDSVIMRIVDLMYVFPMMILVIVIAPMLGTDLFTTLTLYGLLFIPFYTRFMRSTVLQVKQMVYVKAAKTGGAKKFKIMFKHIVPNALSPMIIRFFGGIARTILGIASLAWLGLVDQTVANWGTDINWAQEQFTAFMAAVWPGFFIGIATIGFMLLGDGMRDALDPRLHI
ncbi:MAG: ABC transporter permease [Promethearchaeota archaeon]